MQTTPFNSTNYEENRMRFLIGGILIAIGVVMQGCATAPTSDAKPAMAQSMAVPKAKWLPLPDDLQTLKVNPQAMLKHGIMDCGKDTAIEADCNVNVMMVAPTASTNCQAVTTDAATIKVLKGTKRKLIWLLGQADSDTGVYEFHKQNGIFIAADDDNQIPNAGGWLNNNKSTFWRKDKNDKAGSEVLYLPVVFRRETIGGPRTLCDTVDPRIVNDGP